jgi:hypothetical protein
MLEESFEHHQYKVSDHPLHFFRSERSTVLLGAQALDGFRQLCQVTFNKKTGAIYTQFTYFKECGGLVGRVSAKVDASLVSEIAIGDQGKFATSKVKYSHPPSGHAHFSQDGHVITTYWANSVPLSSAEGHLAELHAFGLTDFDLLQPNERKPKRLYLPFWMDQTPAGAAIVLEWRSRQRLKDWATARGIEVGPVGLIPRRSDGAMIRAALIAPPASAQLNDYVLAMSVHPIETSPKPNLGSVLLLLGGWPFPEQPVHPGSALELLAFLYPADRPGDRAHDNSIDYRRDAVETKVTLIDRKLTYPRASTSAIFVNG